MPLQNNFYLYDVYCTIINNPSLPTTFLIAVTMNMVAITMNMVAVPKFSEAK